MRHLVRATIVGLAGVSLIAGCSSRSSGKTVRVAAAADLSRAFTELAKEFEAKTGIHANIDFGSSGLLAKQIEQGAPYFLFAAANKGFAEQTIKAGRCDGSTAKIYARGRIVVWTRTGVAAPAKLADLADARFKKIAIANPAHAPYGKAAQQALTTAGLWPQIEGRIVMGENIQATMTYAKTGDVDAAVVALSLAVVADGGAFLAIDPSLHEPLDQMMVVCGNGEEADAARQFSDYVDSRDGREIMTRYGFTLPKDAPPSPPP